MKIIKGEDLHRLNLSTLYRLREKYDDLHYSEELYAEEIEGASIQGIGDWDKVNKLKEIVDILDEEIARKKKEEKNNDGRLSSKNEESELKEVLDFFQKYNEDSIFDKEIRDTLKKLIELARKKMIDAKSELEEYEKTLKENKTNDENERGDKNEGIGQI